MQRNDEFWWEAAAWIFVMENAYLITLVFLPSPVCVSIVSWSGTNIYLFIVRYAHELHNFCFSHIHVCQSGWEKLFSTKHALY